MDRMLDGRDFERADADGHVVWALTPGHELEPHVADGLRWFLVKDQDPVIICGNRLLIAGETYVVVHVADTTVVPVVTSIGGADVREITGVKEMMSFDPVY